MCNRICRDEPQIPKHLAFGSVPRYAPIPVGEWRYAMSEYHIGGGLRLLTALEKTEQFAAFLKARMTPALETQDPTELHYLLAQLDDFHSYMWRYYKKLSAERPHRMNPDL